MGALAVALAREAYFGEGIMCVSSVGGRGPGTTLLPNEGMERIKKFFSVCPSYHDDTQKLNKLIWSRCKIAINHACNRYRLNQS